MIRVGMLAAAALLGSFAPYIEAIFPLQQVIAESDVAAGVVEQTDAAGRTCIVRLTKTLKGKVPYAHVRMNLGGGVEAQRETVLKHLVPGATVVIFEGIRTGQVAPKADQRKALIYLNRFFMKFSGRREEAPEKDVWNFEQVEIMLNRTFNGTAGELAALVAGCVSGRQKPPAADPRIPHITKEDLLALPLPETNVVESKLPASFRRIVAADLRTPENPGKTAPGLRVEHYEGTWKEVPDFGALAPAHRSVSPAFQPSDRPREKGMGLRFTGYLEVPRDGTYVFTTSSPGTHRIFFGTTELRVIVEKHPVAAGIDLKAGRHAITAAFVDAGAGGNLQVWWEGPGISRQQVPPSALLHAP